MKNQPVKIIGITRNITEYKQARQKQEKLEDELKKAREKIDKLYELLPICPVCRKVKNSAGYWQSLDRFIESDLKEKTARGLCAECADKLKKNKNTR